MSLPRIAALALAGMMTLGGQGLLVGCGGATSPALAPSAELLPVGVVGPVASPGWGDASGGYLVADGDVTPTATGDVEPPFEPEGADDGLYYIDERGVPQSEAAGADVPPPAAPSAEELASGEEVDDTDPSALTDFRDALDPYGRWVTHPTYGTLWVPNESAVGTRFAPYVTRGRWALTTDDQWVWESSYPFGWVVFHYGRWLYVDGLGWSWVPGRRYAHAWVSFRTQPLGGAYIGWAPLAPSYYWMGGSALYFGYGFPLSYVYIPSRYAFASSVNSYLIYQRYRVRQIAPRTRVVARPPRGVASPSLRALGPARSSVPRNRVAPNSRAVAARRFVSANNAQRSLRGAPQAPLAPGAAAGVRPFGAGGAGAPRGARAQGAARGSGSRDTVGRTVAGVPRAPAGTRNLGPQAAPGSNNSVGTARPGNWSSGPRGSFSASNGARRVTPGARPAQTISTTTARRRTAAGLPPLRSAKRATPSSSGAGRTTTRAAAGAAKRSTPAARPSGGSRRATAVPGVAPGRSAAPRARSSTTTTTRRAAPRRATSGGSSASPSRARAAKPSSSRSPSRSSTTTTGPSRSSSAKSSSSRSSRASTPRSSAPRSSRSSSPRAPRASGGRSGGGRAGGGRSGGGRRR